MKPSPHNLFLHHPPNGVGANPGQSESHGFRLLCTNVSKKTRKGECLTYSSRAAVPSDTQLPLLLLVLFICIPFHLVFTHTPHTPGGTHSTWQAEHMGRIFVHWAPIRCHRLSACDHSSKQAPQGRRSLCFGCRLCSWRAGLWPFTAWCAPSASVNYCLFLFPL